jgi:hypothetical protein
MSIKSAFIPQGLPTAVSKISEIWESCRTSSGLGDLVLVLDPDAMGESDVKSMVTAVLNGSKNLGLSFFSSKPK